MITRVRHAWPEKKGFILDRKNGVEEYIFLHFWQPVKINIEGKEYKTEPDAVVFIDKKTAIKIESKNIDLIYDFIYIKEDKIIEILKNYEIQLNNLYYPQNCAFITDFVSKIECEVFENNKYYKKIVENYLNILIAKIARSLTTQSDGFIVEYKTEYEFKNLRMMVFSNLERDWSIAHMAEIVNMSESRFYVTYKTIFKTTPNQDLILARMDLAKRLLSQNRNASILEVAQKCGYSNEFHFIRIFKKNVGITPKKYSIMHFTPKNK